MAWNFAALCCAIVKGVVAFAAESASRQTLTGGAILLIVAAQHTGSQKGDE